MLYAFIFVIAFFGILSGHFKKLGEINIRRAGGDSGIVIPQLYIPAMYISFVTGLTPYAVILFVGFSIGWLGGLYSIGICIAGGFLCGLLPYSIRHIAVFVSPLCIGWSFYEIYLIAGY